MYLDRDLSPAIEAALADARFRFLVEAVPQVKAGTDGSGVKWAPAQVTFYAALVRRWLSIDPDARTTLETMRVARDRVGLGSAPALREHIEVVPVVAIGEPGLSAGALSGLNLLQSGLLAAGVGWSNLEVGPRERHDEPALGGRRNLMKEGLPRRETPRVLDKTKGGPCNVVRRIGSQPQAS
jgi:hypothetical protein